MKTRLAAKAMTCCMVLAATMLAGSAQAAFLPIDDFDDLAPGPIDDQNGWQAADETSAVVLDPAGSANQVLQVVTESTHLFREVMLLDDTVRMLFLRFRYEDQLNFSLGMSESTYPDQFGEFDAELNMASATSELRINDSGTYTVLTELEAATWYNVWLLIDNDEDVSAVWLHARTGEPALESDRLSTESASVFGFRDANVDDLRTFFIKTGGGNGVLGPLYIDDIQLENTDALNLSNPTSTPTGVTEMPAPPPLLDAYPNPFNPRTTISFDLPQAQHVTLTVHDLAGRAVAVLMAGEQPSGKHALIWNGRDHAGRDVPSGVYFVRLRAEDGVQARKILLAR